MNAEPWNVLIEKLPCANFLQTLQWAEVKEQVGWKREELLWRDDDGSVVAAAQLLIRSTRLLRFGPLISIGYIPRGPLMPWQDEGLTARVLNKLEEVAHQKKLVFLKVDPEVTYVTDGDADDITARNPATAALHLRGWRYSPEQIQFKNTMLLDLSGDEKSWLARMKPKTRYNLRLAQKNGVTVRNASLEDIPLLYKMFAETANRDGFVIRPEAYYTDVWTRFMNADMAQGLVAEVAGVPIAGLVFFYFGTRAWFVYGMSTGQHRDKMPNYLLQWEAMLSAYKKGCTVYDLWGAPDKFDESDSLYGVYRFKEGFGAEISRTIGAWDFPVNHILYRVYHQVIPRVLSITRFFRRKQMQQEVE